jgi:uncharacterized membrane protein SirB2
MQKLLFWKNWLPTKRVLYSACLFLLVLATATTLAFQYRGFDNVVSWDVLSELDETPVKLDSLQSQALIGKAYVIKEQFVPSKMATDGWATWLYLLLNLTGFSLVVAAVSAFSRRWYLGAMMLIIGLLSFFHLESLQIFSTDNQAAFIVAVAALGGLSYYFNAFRADISIIQRIVIFAALLLGLSLIFGFGATAQLPTQTFVAYSLPVFVVISLGFIGWTSFEIIGGLVYVISNRQAGMAHNSLRNFLIVSTLYLLTVLLIFLKNTGIISEGYWLVSPFLLLVASVWLGVWSFEKRTESVFAFRESGAWLYVGLALILFATIGYAFATDNVPLVSVFQDSIVDGQLGLGLLFVFYVGINFWPLFKKGYEVHKVLYKPLQFSILQTFIVGAVAVLLLLLYQEFAIVQQFNAASNNALGDLYTNTKDYVLAEQYYKTALAQAPQNHKSNYALASLALTQGDNTTAGVYFKQAIAKNPTPHDYAGLSQSLMTENLIFDAIFNLRAGVKAFPKSGELQNNLGYLYFKTKIADSTFYYFDLARQNAHRPEIPETNMLALFAKNPTFTAPELPKASSYNSLEANRFVLDKSKLKSDINITLLPDSGLSVSNFAYLYNRAIYERDTADLTLLQKLQNKNGSLYEDLETARAFINYYKADKIAGFDLLASQIVADTSQKTALARQTLAFWLNKETTENPDISNLKDLPNLLRRHPFNVTLLQKATEYYNKNKQPKLAYEAILRALRFSRNSPEIQKLYILQSTELGFTEFAQDGLNALFTLTSPADYQSFLQIYQSKRSLIEKELQSFK